MSAALLIGAASASLFFLAGRLSVKIMPLEVTVRTATDRQPKVDPVGAHKERAATAPSEDTRGSSATLSGARDEASAERNTPPESRSTPAARTSEEQAATLAPTEQKVGERALTGPDPHKALAPEPAAKTPAPGRLVVINGGSAANAGRAAVNGPPGIAGAAAQADKPDDAAFGQCERRYSSFRRSDSTYQPLDGGPRRRCPLLR